MKAERRHELQENSLARSVTNFPQFWRDYGSKIALFIILVLLTIVLVRYWLRSREEANLATLQRLTSARTALERFRAGEVTEETLATLDEQTRRGVQFMMQMGNSSLLPMLPVETQNQVRRGTWDTVDEAVRQVLADAKEPDRQARAILLRGDLNLYWSNLARTVGTPASQPATTQEASSQPVINTAASGVPDSADTYLDRAKSDYESLIAKAGSLPMDLVNSARMGLAAVHENRGQRDEAIKLYDQVRNETPLETAKQIAAARIRILTQLASAPLIGPTSKPSTQPSDALLPAGPPAPIGPPAPSTTPSTAATSTSATPMPMSMPATTTPTTESAATQPVAP